MRIRIIAVRAVSICARIGLMLALSQVVRLKTGLVALSDRIEGTRIMTYIDLFPRREAMVISILWSLTDAMYYQTKVTTLRVLLFGLAFSLCTFLEY